MNISSDIHFRVALEMVLLFFLYASKGFQQKDAINVKIFGHILTKQYIYDNTDLT